MKLCGKNILLISPQAWEHVFVSKHHYAIALGAAGNKVYFLNPPSGGYRISGTSFKNVFCLNYPGFLVGFRFLPAPVKRLYMRAIITELEKVAEARFDVVWSFDNSVFFDLAAFSTDTLKISHIVDLNQDFNFRVHAQTADLCISTNRDVVEKFKHFNRTAYYINHAVPTERPDEGKNFDLPGSNAMKAGYAGNLDIPYIDWPLLETIVEENPGVDFILAGPCKEKSFLSRLLGRANVFHVGVLSLWELFAFYNHVDILILCYVADKFRSQVSNPHKMMEYLSSGKMICSTFTLEYAGLANDGMFIMSHTNDGFSSLFKRCADELEYWNSDQLKARRISFAQEHTYDKQLARIEGLIEALGRDVRKLHGSKLLSLSGDAKHIL